VGLHIWYSLVLPPPASFDDAIEKMRQLHDAAHTVGFTGHDEIPAVGEIQLGTASDDDAEERSVEMSSGESIVEPIWVRASRWVRFSTMPGPGAETALFSLGEYPEYVDGTPPLTSIRVGAPPGFSGTNGFCKTHYASRFGEEHFLRCHLALIQLLDHAQELGILARVSDDGHYWETRSEQVLLNNLREHSAVLSAIVGNLKDQFEKRGDQTMHFSAPITAMPDFEHLEAEGRRRLADRQL
jgi:hypothetical protein